MFWTRRGPEKKSSFSSNSNVEVAPMMTSRSLSLQSVFTYHPDDSCNFINIAPNRYYQKAEERVSEISVYNTRTQRYITKHERMRIDSALSSSVKVIAKIAEKLKIEKDCVLFQQCEAISGASLHPPFVVVLPELRSPKTVVLLLYCHCFEQFKDKKRYCLRIDRTLKMSEIKEIITAELEWKGAEIYINGEYISDDRAPEDFNMHDLSQLEAAKQVAKTVTLLHEPSSNIATRFKFSIYASDSVKHVKQKFLKLFKSKLTTEYNTGDCLHITCANVLMNDKECFGLTDKFHKEDMYQIHFAPVDAVLCHLHCQTGKERMRDWERRTVLMSPNCSTADLREKASKFMRVDPKSVRLNIHNKQIDEATNICEVFTLYSGCLIFAGITKKKTLLVKHPALDRPEKVADVYALEPVSTLRKLAAKRYGITELQFDIKYKGTTMKDSESFYNYPIENNIVLELHIFERRLNIVAHITFKRTKFFLIIDDCEKTTIDEILKYCAVQLQYRSRCSRCVYGERCLDKNLTLHAAGLISGCKVDIIYFSEEDHSNNSLKRIFMASTDGRIIPRYGGVIEGHLLYASKKVKMTPSQRGCYEEETLPEGIYKTQPARERRENDTESPAIEPSQDTIENTKKKRELKKRFFLEKARRLIKKKFQKTARQDENNLLTSGHKDQTCVKKVFSCEAFPLQECSVRSDDGTQITEDTNQTFVKNVFSDYSENSVPLTEEMSDLCRPKFYLGVQELQTQSAKPAHKENLSESVTDGCPIQSTEKNSYNASDQNQASETCMKAKDVSSGTKASSNSVNHSEVSLSLNRSETPFNPSYSHNGNLEEKTCKSVCQGNSSNTVEELNLTPDTLPCSNTHLEDKLGNGRRYQSNLSLSHYILNDVSIKATMEKNVGNTVDSNTSSDSGLRIDKVNKDSQFSTTYDLVLLPRRRTESDNSKEVSLYPRQWLMPFQAQQYKQVNRLLETAGISIQLLDHVSKEIGIDWKRLARKLEVDEGDITEIEHNHKSSLCEAAFQSLVVWKKQHGSQASRQCLQSALREIKLNHLAEACENYQSGYQTA